MLRYAGKMEAGTQGSYDYSDTNYVLLGLIIEKKTGTTTPHMQSPRDSSHNSLNSIVSKSP